MPSVAKDKPVSYAVRPPPQHPALPPPTPNFNPQWLFTEAELQETPSVVAGLSPEKERENRAKGVNFILQVGIMLKIPQMTLSTASVFLHRFFMRFPMIEDKVYGRPHHHYYSIAATCLFLATKVEETCRKMKEIVVACVRVAQKNPNKVVDEQDKEFWRWKDTILQLEDVLLEALCFDLSIELPHRPLFHYLQYFGEDHNKVLRNAAWAFVNDSCLPPLCLLWPSRTIAAAAFYAAARHCGVKIFDDKDGRPWWEVLGVKLQSIQKVCNSMAAVYENTPLRGGYEESIYQRTPEDGDEAEAKTRQRRTEGWLEEAGVHSERAGSAASSVTASEMSRKRSRDGDEGSSQADLARDLHENKKLKTDGAMDLDDARNGHGAKERRNDTSDAGSKVGKENDLSEEGEIEEGEIE